MVLDGQQVEIEVVGTLSEPELAGAGDGVIDIPNDSGRLSAFMSFSLNVAAQSRAARSAGYRNGRPGLKSGRRSRVPAMVASS